MLALDTAKGSDISNYANHVHRNLFPYSGSQAINLDKMAFRFHRRTVLQPHLRFDTANQEAEENLD